MVSPLHELSGPCYSGMTIGSVASARIQGTREQGIARRRMEPGGVYQRSPLKSAIYYPLVPALSRSRIFPNMLESSLCCFVSSCRLQSRPAIRCSMVRYEPRCSPCLRVVSADVVVA